MSATVAAARPTEAARPATAVRWGKSSFMTSLLVNAAHVFGVLLVLQESTRPHPTRARARHGRPALRANTSAMVVQPAAIEYAQTATTV